MKRVILLVDDQPFVAEALSVMLAAQDDLELAYCDEPTRALAMAKSLSASVILQDLVMPDADGIDLLKSYRADPALADVPVVMLSAREEGEVKARAFAAGANDYIVKLPEQVELVARLTYHSRVYSALIGRNQAFRELQESQAELAEELRRAARYVEGLLPKKIQTPVKADWRFVPSAELGGDILGYHAVDETHFALYVVDVSGHGIGPGLLSVQVASFLGSRAVPGVDFRNPSQVLAALNDAFPMERHDSLFFTAWYGVFDHVTRRLCWAQGGHPSAVLVTPTELAPVELDADGSMLGLVPEATFETREMVVPEGSNLYVFSDGAFEVSDAEGNVGNYDDFVLRVAAIDRLSDRPLDDLLAEARERRGGGLEDDFSLLRVELG